MTTGDSTDILARVKRLIPFRWFQWAAPLRDAVIGGLSDCVANLYSFIVYTRTQTRLATATGIWLDVFCYDYLRRFLLRNGRGDAVYRALIQATILQERVTRAGMVSAVTKLIKIPPYIFEPWNTNDAGAYRAPNIGYGVAGGWGSLQYPGQVFVRVTRIGLGPAGVPNVGGWYRGQNSGSAPGGYGQGQLEYINTTTPEIGVTDNDIFQVIAQTKPSGVTCWVQIGDGTTSTLVGQAASIGGSLPFLPLIVPETNPQSFVSGFIARYTPAKLTIRRYGMN